uniref:UPF0182 protein n=1 Tax=Meloidogyne hapla TaxID=6305 RepID=A0A1I8BT55_MELHA
MFLEEYSLGELLDSQIGLVVMKNLETALMKRLKALDSYVYNREERLGINLEEKSFLKLIYEKAVLDINLDYEKPVAIIGTPRKVFYNKIENNLMEKYGINLEEARERIINRKIKDLQKLFGENLIPYAIHKDDTVVNITAKEHAKLQIEGKAFEIRYNEEDQYVYLYYGKNSEIIPFDLFFCAGGSKDQIRDRFLGEPQVLTNSKNYGLTIIDKVDHLLNITLENYTYRMEPMIVMMNFLIREQIDEFINNSDISDQIKNCYENIIGLITNDVLVLHIFELKQRITIGFLTPVAIVELIKEIENEKDKLENSYKRENYEKFRKELENKWAKAFGFPGETNGGVGLWKDIEGRKVEVRETRRLLQKVFTENSFYRKFVLDHGRKSARMAWP